MAVANPEFLNPSLLASRLRYHTSHIGASFLENCSGELVTDKLNSLRKFQKMKNLKPVLEKKNFGRGRGISFRPHFTREYSLSSDRSCHLSLKGEMTPMSKSLMEIFFFKLENVGIYFVG
ncbi:hypothetical protein QTP88_013007 [Uroleucon formosanum]